MEKYLVILAWKSAKFDEKIGNVAIVQAFNEAEAKKKVLKMYGFNKDVEKNLKVYDIEDLIDGWSYFGRGGII